MAKEGGACQVGAVPGLQQRQHLSLEHLQQGVGAATGPGSVAGVALLRTGGCRRVVACAPRGDHRPLAAGKAQAGHQQRCAFAQPRQAVGNGLQQVLAIEQQQRGQRWGRCRARGVACDGSGQGRLVPGRGLPVCAVGIVAWRLGCPAGARRGRARIGRVGPTGQPDTQPQLTAIDTRHGMFGDDSGGRQVLGWAGWFHGKSRAQRCPEGCAFRSTM